MSTSKKNSSPEIPRNVAIGGITAIAIIAVGLLWFFVFGPGSASNAGVVYDPNYKPESDGRGVRAPAPEGGYPELRGSDRPTGDRPPGSR